MYVITGATGNTGKVVTKNLLQNEQQVRIISRSAEKSKELTEAGAELFQGNTDDAKFLKKAFSGAKAVYVVIPPDWSADDYTAAQVKHFEAIAEALEDTKVKNVVALSSQGADKPSGTGVVYGLHLMEERFKKIPDANILFLRAGYFMENTLGMTGLLKQNGILGSPLKPDVKISVIATRDIGEYAAKRLLALDFEGKQFQDLLGQRDVTYAEITKVYGSAVGKPEASYVEFPAENFKESLMSAGGSASVAEKMVEFIDALNKGMVTIPERTPESNTSTSIEDFAQTFKHVYEMQ